MKQKQNLQFNKWNDFSYKVNNQLITENIIKESLLFFKNSISFFHEQNLEYTNNPLKLAIIFKIKTINNQYRSISHLQVIDFIDFNKLNKLFIECWHLKDEEYYLAPHSDIIFT